MRSGHGERRRRAEREREAAANRRQYRTWQDVLAAGFWFRCSACGQGQFVEGDVTTRECPRCGTKLCEVGV